MTVKFYIASRIENIPQVQELRDLLVVAGWECTYDWTVHGSVRSDSPETDRAGDVRIRIAQVAQAEVDGVIKSDVFAALLPGGRGTHVELGASLVGPRDVVLWSPDPNKDFGVTKETSASYHHPRVWPRWDSTMQGLATWLVHHLHRSPLTP